MDSSADVTALLRVASAVHSTLDIDAVFRQVLGAVRDSLGVEASSLILLDEERSKLVFRGASGEKADEIKQFELDVGEGIAGWVVEHDEPVVSEDARRDPRHKSQIDSALDFTTRAMITVPVRLADRVIGALQILNPLEAREFGPDALPTLEAVAAQVATAIANARMYAAVRQDKEGLEELLGVREHVVGESSAMRRLLSRMAQLSRTDGPVLLVGEPGVGKRRLAHTIHEASPRKHEALIVFRCDEVSHGELSAALSDNWQGGPTLLDRPGTVYFHEIGAAPPDLQERLANACASASARVMAGFSRLTAAGETPIPLAQPLLDLVGDAVLDVPPLRERPDDIPHLVGYFLRRTNTRLARAVKGFHHEVLRFFMDRAWRGNVQELEGLVSRAVAASEGDGMIHMEALSKVVDVGGLAGLASGPSDWLPSVLGKTVSSEGLLAALRSPDASARSAALREIRQVRPAGAAPEIASCVLRDEQDVVRLQAAGALGELGDPSVVPALLAVVSQEKAAEVVAATLTSLGQLAQGKPSVSEQVCPTLLLYLRDANPRLRLSAVRAIDALRADDARETLSGMTADTDPDVRCMVNLVLHRLGDAEAIWRLKAELRHPSAVSRTAACGPLGRTGKGTAELVAIMNGDREHDVRMSAAAALGVSGSAEAVKPLLYKLDDPLLRMTAIRSLGRLCAEAQLAAAECVSALLEVAANEKSSMVRRAAVEALGEIRDASAVSHLTALLDDPKIATSVIQALSQIGGAEAEDALIPLLRPGPGCVEAIDGIARIGTAKSVAPLVGLLTADDYLAQQATQALMCLGEAAEPALIAGLADDRKRHWCAPCLGALGSARAVPTLLKLYDESEAAREALVEIGERGIEQIVSALPECREAASHVFLKLGDAGVAPLVAVIEEGEPQKVAFASSVLADLGSACADAVAEALTRAEAPRPKVVLAALLGRVGDVNHATVLIALLDDDSADVRRVAIRALGHIGGAHVIRILGERVHSDASDGASRDRVAGLDALRQTADEQALPVVVRALSAPSWAVRLAAVQALSGFRLDAVAEHLFAATEDADERVARSAVRGADAAGLLSVDTLRASAIDQANPTPARSQAVRILAMMTCFAAKEALAAVWAQLEDADLKALIVEKSSAEGAAAIPWLAALAHSGDERQVAFAQATAAQLCYDPLAVQAAVTSIGEAGPGVRELLWQHLDANRADALATLESLLRRDRSDPTQGHVIQLLDDLQKHATGDSEHVGAR